ncbi:MAG: histidine phosphatase family protein [Candidatus Rokubacteria bacterium]|nr:histidine phosphatase family protein [Candidatus Rokubacteria bacterium]
MSSPTVSGSIAARSVDGSGPTAVRGAPDCALGPPAADRRSSPPGPERRGAWGCVSHPPCPTSYNAPVVSVLRLFVLRHGETESSRERRFTGRRDIALTPAGQRQAEAAAEALASAGLQAVYASPLERTRATAELIAKPHRLPIRFDPRFAEMGFGEWEGLTWREAAASAPELFTRWQAAPHDVTAPGGESLLAVAGRVADGVAALQAAHPDGTVALVTHAMVVRLIVLAALGLAPDRLWSVDASPGGLTEIEYRPGWVTVHRMNTLSHLDRVVA